MHRVETNTRTSAMWRGIAEHVDFESKRVIDLGCGHGDLTWRIWEAGAMTVVGLDNDPEMAQQKSDIDGDRTVFFYQADINELVDKDRNWEPPFDVAVCCSVLPYLNDIRRTLAWMTRHFKTSIIECQYAGDGPGPSWIKNGQDMKQLLGAYWSKTQAIGMSYVKDRRTLRVIWLCE